MVSSLPLLRCLTDAATRFCIEMNSARTQQTATDSLFRAVSNYAADIPIIIVATKMDQFRGIQRQEADELYGEALKTKPSYTISVQYTLQSSYISVWS